MGKWKRTFLYQVLPYNHYIKGISLLVWLCFHIYELRELKWSLLFLPVCPPNIRTTQNSRVLITPGPFPVDSPSAANNETAVQEAPWRNTMLLWLCCPGSSLSSPLPQGICTAHPHCHLTQWAFKNYCYLKTIPFVFPYLKMEAERCFRWENWTRDVEPLMELKRVLRTLRVKER